MCPVPSVLGRLGFSLGAWHSGFFTLGGAIAQALIAIQWRGLRSRADFRDFREMQAGEPYLLAMGREDQRALATG